MGLSVWPFGPDCDGKIEDFDAAPQGAEGFLPRGPVVKETVE